MCFNATALCLQAGCNTDCKSEVAQYPSVHNAAAVIAQVPQAQGTADEHFCNVPAAQLAADIFRAPAQPLLEEGHQQSAGACAAASPAAIPVTEALTVCMPDTEARCARLAQLPVATLAASSPAHLGLLPACGLAQPRLAQFPRVEALVLARADSKECPERGALLSCQQAFSAAEEEALQQISDEDSALCEVLRKLRHLDLANNKLGEDANATRLFAAQLRGLSSLTFLSLYSNPLVGDTLMFGRTSMPKLQHLDISRCHGFGKRGAASIKNLTALTHLNLSRATFNNWDAGGAASDTPVANALSTLRSLQHLQLSHAHLQAADVTALCSTALIHLSALTSLLWQDDHREHDGIACNLLAAILSHHMPGLVHLDLSCQYAPAGGGGIAGELAVHAGQDSHGPDATPHLTHLALQGRSLGRSNMQVQLPSFCCHRHNHG